MQRRPLLAWLSLAWAVPAQALEPPALMLARVYRAGRSVDGFWVSEKLDGVRARWDGARLVSRGGEVIMAPPWFTAGWPADPLDGELWIARGRFEDTLSAVRPLVPDDAAWRAVRFMVFDMPAHGGRFTERLEAIAAAVARVDRPWLQAVAQFRVPDEASLMARLAAVERAGGEGLMLHHGDARYEARRSDDLLKLKSHDDAEARVVGHVPGRGRLQGRMGALWLETPEGRRFKLGTGFTDARRADPPPLGALVTYRFRGLTERGLPRFASFVRVREDRLRP